MISFSQQRGGAIKQIQRGVVALSGTTTSVNVTISAVNPAYTEMRNLGARGQGSDYGMGTNVQLFGCSVQLLDATTITVAMSGTAISGGGSASVSWELTEYYPT